MIDTSDIREMTKEDFAKGRKNPFAEKIRKEGYSITVHYTPEDVANMRNRNVKNVDDLDLDPDEQKALEKYHTANGI